MKFTKVVASGNDFVLIDNKDGSLQDNNLNYSEFAKDVCRRRLSVGADGVLVLENSETASFRMRVINPDGSEVDMCGNGARCSAFYAAVQGWGNELKVETGAGIIGAEVNGNNVKLKMSDPKDTKLGINLGLGSSIVTTHFINTGVEHVVHIVEGLENYDVENIGRKIREHTLFAPEGTNANFVGDITENSAAIRTYERGVEGETLACGTGAVASAIVLGLLGQVTSPVNIRTTSGEVLKVFYALSNKKVTDVYLEGAAKIVCEGKV